MAWTIDYNSYGSTTTDWEAIDISEYKSEPVYATDGFTHETTQHTLSGTAIINGSNDANFKDAIKDARQKLVRQGKTLLIKIGSETVVNVTGGASASGEETLAGPQGVFQLTNIYGTRSALVGFSITWFDYETITGDGSETYHVLSHWWTQRFTIGDNGNARRIINGALKVASDALAAGTSPQLGPNPDAYRGLIMPELVGGHRIVQMDFATDESAQRLIYTIETQEYPRNLPAPARKGQANFRWTRSNFSGPDGFIGRKVFDGELEGDITASGTELLRQLVQVSKNRIKYTPPNHDLIMEVEVSELDVFNANRVGYRVVAMSTGQAPQAIPSTPNFKLLQDLTLNTPDYEPPNPYGASLIRSVRRTLFDQSSGYTEATFPIAEHESVEEPTLRQYTAPAALFEQVDPQMIDAGQQQHAVRESHHQYPYTQARIIERIVAHSNMIELKAQSIDGASTPWQTSKPDVYIYSELRVTRQGKAPEHVHMKPLIGGMVIRQEYNVGPGPADSNNNQAVMGVYRRLIKVIPQIDTGNMWFKDVITIPGAGSLEFVRWHPPGGSLAFPADPRSEEPSIARNRSLANPHPISEFNFQIPAIPLVTVGQ